MTLILIILIYGIPCPLLISCPLPILYILAWDRDKHNFKVLEWPVHMKELTIKLPWLDFLGGWPAPVHRPEWVDTCELCPVVSGGVWGWGGLAEERAHGSHTRKTAGEYTHRPHLSFPHFLRVFAHRFCTALPTLDSPVFNTIPHTGTDDRGCPDFCTGVRGLYSGIEWIRALPV